MIAADGMEVKVGQTVARHSVSVKLLTVTTIVEDYYGWSLAIATFEWLSSNGY